ncbi:MAG: hypothetical protein ACI9MC_001005 [Kiritimatiellia bacterium]|jgi:hypothetical protein
MRRDLISLVLGATIGALALGNLFMEARIQHVERELSDAREASEVVPALPALAVAAPNS